LAVTSATRSAALPDDPDGGVNSCRATRRAGGLAFGAPKNTPAKIIDTLNREINAGLADPTMKARIAAAVRVTTTMTAVDSIERHERHELPSPHSITSSARASSEGGTVRPSAFYCALSTRGSNNRLPAAPMT